MQGITYGSYYWFPNCKTMLVAMATIPQATLGVFRGVWQIWTLETSWMSFTTPLGTKWKWETFVREGVNRNFSNQALAPGLSRETSALHFRHSFWSHERLRKICRETETCLEVAIRQGIRARIMTGSFTSALFNPVEDRVSQPTFDLTSDTLTKTFFRNSGKDYFKSLCARIKTR